ncbi:MAG: hypothetical protein O3A00_17265 [Planctomycetota bacterium]|nr:hypothetical protein [Planctomycetota bacterium]
MLQATNRLAEAEPLMRRHVEIQFGKETGHEHPHLQAALQNYRRLLKQMGRSDAAIKAAMQDNEQLQ